ncbi:MAG: DUF4440 domain-containing protein [Planctomycetota bacterium]|nr:DUF4440 domain-containing protein [Planctomycetota bacterium]
MKILVASILALCAVSLIQDTEPAVDEKAEKLRRAVEALSHSMSTEGAGPEAYAELLRDDFTRWFVGRQIVEKEELVESLETWWKDGNRVAENRSRIVALDLSESVGIVRLEASESFVDQDGAGAGAFEGFVDQVWILRDERWKLLAANIAPEPEQK